MADWKLKRQVLKAASFLMLIMGCLTVYLIYLSTWEADSLAANPLKQLRAQISGVGQSSMRRGGCWLRTGQMEHAVIRWGQRWQLLRGIMVRRLAVRVSKDMRIVNF